MKAAEGIRKNLRLSAFINAETLRVLDSATTYCGAIRVHALQRRDSGRLYLRFVIFRATQFNAGRLLRGILKLAKIDPDDFSKYL
ncbi:MAG: hypothetical protein O8C67_13975 [Candidatus Methanoperedens sp.]|nr:hypothetical protein [Candidatus Methanoperedens sp.]MCZ7406019.1 hypothetical protein [Candidatus Methanoperedens sp.]